MNIITVCLIAYFIIGFILAFIWWNDEYRPEYEYEEHDGEEPEKSMAIILLALLFVFWPVKLVKNWLEGIYF